MAESLLKIRQNIGIKLMYIFYNRFAKISIIVMLTYLLAGCFSPAILENQPRCQLFTKELKLTLSEEGSQALVGGIFGSLSSPNSCDSPECFLIIPLGILAISVTSLIVSGSIVVAGNTVHWVEREGMCHNSVIRGAVDNLINSIQTIGGKTIKSASELSLWFKQNLSVKF